MIVVDASATIDFLLDTPPAAEEIADWFRRNDGDLHAPRLLEVEVGQVLRRYTLNREIDAERARRALARLGAMPFTLYPHGPLLDRAFVLRENLTMYDAVYVVLAEALDVELVTRDDGLGEAPGHHARVVVIGS